MDEIVSLTKVGRNEKNKLLTKNLFMLKIYFTRTLIGSILFVN